MLKIVLCGLFLVAACHALSDSEVLEQWNEFQAKHGKTYKSPIEARKRLNIFRKNLEEIEEHNARYQKGEETYYQGVNKFTDLSDEELSELTSEILPNLEQSEAFLGWHEDSNLTYAPESRDWRENTQILEPEAQGECEACWAFSTTGAVEAHLAIKGTPIERLSKQNLVDCCKGSPYLSMGCKRGVPNDAYNFMKTNGVDSEANYPYEAVDGSCRQKNSIVKIKGFRGVPAKESAIENVVGNTGPASSAVCAIKSLYKYKGGIYSDSGCDCELNHAVLIIGYGAENGVKYWIIKNSWGTEWGDKGYLKLKKGENACRIDTYCNYPQV